MKKCKYFFGISLFLILSCSHLRKESIDLQDSSDKYNLLFNRPISVLNIDNWHPSGRLFRFYSDSLNTIKKGSSIYLETSKSIPNIHAYGKLYQILTFPKKTYKTKINIWSKNPSVNQAYVKLYLKSKLDQIVLKDSIKIEPATNWRQYSSTINSSNGSSLYIELSLDEDCRVWFDDLEVRFDGNTIYASNDGNTKEIIKDTSKIQMQPLDLLEDIYSISKIKELSDKKIIGLGESLHGSHEMAVVRNQIIKYMVEKNNCKLIIFEGPDTYLAQLNKFIQSKTKSKDWFNIGDINNKAQYYYFTEEMTDLLLWLKNYNYSVKDKVVICGMDVSFQHQSNLNRYFERHWRNNQLCYKLIKILDNSEAFILLDQIENNKGKLMQIDDSLSYYDILNAAEGFKECSMVYNYSINNNYVRDSIMAQKIIKAINQNIKGDEKTIICGHLLHLNRIDEMNGIARSIGYWLDNQYKNEYFVLAFLTGIGTYQAFQISSDIKNIGTLKFPPQNSIESFCLRLNSNIFYLPTNIIDENKQFLIRIIGGITENRQFYPGSVVKRFNALIFIKESTPIKFYHSLLKQQQLLINKTFDKL